MDRVTIEQQEGVIRIQVNYTQEMVVKILGAIFIGLWAAIAVPVFSYEIATSPHVGPYALPMVMISIVCTAGGLLAWWCYSNHLQMMSVTPQDGILEVVHAFKFLRFPRWYRLGDLGDIMMDAKRTETPGDKYFLQVRTVDGQWIKITRPSIRIPKEEVENIYDALRPHIPLPPPVQRLAFFPHIKVIESEAQTTITFRTRIHFILVRYYGILYSMVGFLVFPVVLTIALGVPEMLLYPGSAMIGLILVLYLPFLLPMRKKHLAHNHNVATLQINHDRPTIAVSSSVKGVRHDYPSILLKSIKHVPLSTGSELTFARHGTTEYTAFYTIFLNVGTPEEIFLYTTENDAEAEHVKEFLENLANGTNN